MRTAQVILTQSGTGNTSAIQLQLHDSAIKTEENVRNAVKKAVQYYIKKTARGKADFEYNGECFNWADFENLVPAEICRKFGFEPIRQNPQISFIADLHEQLY